MKIRMRRSVRGQAGMLYKDHLVEVEDMYAKELIKKGFATKADKDKETTIEIEEIETNIEAPEEIKINDLTVAKLKEIAKEKGIAGYSSMKKQELIDELVGG